MPDCSDEMQAFAAGFAEGHVTAHLIAAHARNVAAQWRSFEDDRTFPTPSVKQWLTDNVEFMTMQSRLRPFDAFWRQVGLVLHQLRGVVAGVAATGHDTPFLSLLLSNYDAELFDIIDAIDRQDRQSWQRLSPRRLERRMRPRLHCSAVVALAKGNSELFTAHNTWCGYYSMLRVFKHYSFPFSYSAPVTVSMSSYPGVIHSTDDWYELRQPTSLCHPLPPKPIYVNAAYQVQPCEHDCN
jgi:hypothetical protein